MEENRYPQLDEEHTAGLASEPVGMALSPAKTEAYDRTGDLDWTHFPSYGPFSEEEAIARIDQFEEKLEKGEVKWISSEKAWAQLYEKFPWLR